MRVLYNNCDCFHYYSGAKYRHWPPEKCLLELYWIHSLLTQSRIPQRFRIAVRSISYSGFVRSVSPTNAPAFSPLTLYTCNHLPFYLLLIDLKKGISGVVSAGDSDFVIVVVHCLVR